LQKSSAMQKISIILSLVSIVEIIFNCLIFNYKNNKIIQLCNLFFTLFRFFLNGTQVNNLTLSNPFFFFVQVDKSTLFYFSIEKIKTVFQLIACFSQLKEKTGRCTMSTKKKFKEFFNKNIAVL